MIIAMNTTRAPFASTTLALALLAFLLLLPAPVLSAPPQMAASRAQSVQVDGDKAYRDGNHRAALFSYTKSIRLNPRNAYAYFGRGASLYYLGAPRKAFDALTRAIQLNPDFADAYFARAYARRELHDRKGAIADDTQAIAHADGNMSPPNVSSAYADRAFLRFERHDIQGAQQDIDKSVTLDSDNPQSFVSRAWLRRKMGDWQGASEDATHALTMMSNDGAAYSERAWVRFLRRDYAGALSDINLALAGDTMGLPGYVASESEQRRSKSIYVLQRADIYTALDEKARALADDDAGLRLNPHNASAYAARAGLEASAGQSRAALADYRKAIVFYRRQGEDSEVTNSQTLAANLLTP